MEFYQRLKELRLTRGLTQVALAKELNIAERQYQRLETNNSKPKYENLISLADYFGVSLDYLTGRTDKPEINK